MENYKTNVIKKAGIKGEEYVNYIGNVVKDEKTGLQYK